MLTTAIAVQPRRKLGSAEPVNWFEHLGPTKTGPKTRDPGTLEPPRAFRGQGNPPRLPCKTSYVQRCQLAAHDDPRTDAGALVKINDVGVGQTNAA